MVGDSACRAGTERAPIPVWAHPVADFGARMAKVIRVGNVEGLSAEQLQLCVHANRPCVRKCNHHKG